MSARSYSRRQLMAGCYEIIPSAEFPAGVYVDLPLKVTDNNWTLVGAYALKQLPKTHYSKIITDYRTGTGTGIARTGFSTGVANQRTVSCYCHTSNAGGYTWTYPSTLRTKVTFTLRYGTVTLNGTSYTLKSGNPNPNTSYNVRINDERSGALNMIFYNMTATHSNVLTYDFRVARRVGDGLIGIIDTVTGVFITPLGGKLLPYNS